MLGVMTHHHLIILLQVGACIVNKAGKIVGIGYNGFPLRVSDDDPQISWGKRKGAHPIDVKYPYGM